MTPAPVRVFDLATATTPGGATLTTFGTMAVADAAATADIASRETRDEWLDRNSGRIMVLPAVVILLAFAIFPLIVSIYLSLCRFALAGGSFTLTFIGLFNYKRLLFGAQQYHLIGTMKPLETPQWIALAAYVVIILYWLGRYVATDFSVPGLVGAYFREPGDRDCHCGARDHSRRRLRRHADHDLLLCARRRLRAVSPRPRPGAAVCPAHSGAQLLPGRVLHSANGDASRRRIYVPHAGRHAEGPLRPPQRGI